jgi:hypothetical protein
MMVRFCSDVAEHQILVGGVIYKVSCPHLFQLISLPGWQLHAIFSCQEDPVCFLLLKRLFSDLLVDIVASIIGPGEAVNTQRCKMGSQETLAEPAGNHSFSRS